MVSENLGICRERISRAAGRSGRPEQGVALVAVTKGVAPDAIEEALAAGAGDIGESRVQEALAKHERLDRFARRAGRALRWHLIGHLQTNKAREAVRIFDVIHSVDSVRVAEAIERHAARADKKQRVLLEVNVSGEGSKYGFSPAETRADLARIAAFPHVCVAGLMTVAPYSDDPERARPVFRRLRELRDELNGLRIPGLGLRELSMGMTDDFEVAVEEGATWVRLGRVLFGERHG
ncbi:MAG: YggS family pyridoxal phosphate-dependent enzyme [Deltaproteobacteria bacterium]